MRSKFTQDTSQANAFAGYITGMTTMVNTRRYIDAALSYAVAELIEAFGNDMDRHALTHPDNFHHVYEWGDEYRERGETAGTVGIRTKRLWRVEPVGRGRKRVVGFTFLPSHEPSPIHPSLLRPGGRNDEYVKPDVHIFTWKAPVMEYGIKVKITPQLSPKKMLAFVDDETGKLIFTTKTIEAVPGEGHPGSGGNIGMFTGYFVRWWSSESAVRFDRDIRPVLERDVADEAAIRGVIGKYKKPKAMTIGMQSNTTFRAGEAEARRKFGRTQAEYIARAARRRMERYGY